MMQLRPQTGPPAAPNPTSPHYHDRHHQRHQRIPTQRHHPDAATDNQRRSTCSRQGLDAVKLRASGATYMWAIDASGPIPGA